MAIALPLDPLGSAMIRRNAAISLFVLAVLYEGDVVIPRNGLIAER